MPPAQTSLFISYSYDSEEHRDWVRQLALRLDAEPYLHVVFDQFDLYGGRDLTHFMDTALQSERILVICTPPYAAKAASRTGGVGYECSIISSDLAASQAQDKFVPILRSGTDIVSFLRSKTYIDARDPKPLVMVSEEVLGAIRREGTVQRPLKRAFLANASKPKTLSVPYEIVPPPTRPPLPALARFGVSWSNAGYISFEVINEGDGKLFSVEVGVSIAGLPSFTIDFGDLEPGAERKVPLQNGPVPEHRTALREHLYRLIYGQVEPQPQDHLLLTYLDIEGGQHAAAYVLVRNRKSQGLEIQAAKINVR